jgi:hypothetical protein
MIGCRDRRQRYRDRGAGVGLRNDASETTIKIARFFPASAIKETGLFPELIKNMDMPKGT